MPLFLEPPHFQGYAGALPQVIEGVGSLTRQPPSLTLNHPPCAEMRRRVGRGRPCPRGVSASTVDKARHPGGRSPARNLGLSDAGCRQQHTVGPLNQTAGGQCPGAFPALGRSERGRADRRRHGADGSQRCWGAGALQADRPGHLRFQQRQDVAQPGGLTESGGQQPQAPTAPAHHTEAAPTLKPTIAHQTQRKYQQCDNCSA